MLNKSVIIVLCTLLICDPLMKLQLVNAGKSFFTKENEGEDKKLKAFEGSGDGDREAKRSHSLGMKFFDEISYVIFQLGDRFSGGLPDNMIWMAKYCIEFIPKGLAALGYTQIRWPHKLMLKGMIFLVAIGILKTNGVYCLSPISMGRFIAMAKMVNTANDELVKIRDEFTVRVLNSATKIDNPTERMKHVACAYISYKRKTVEAVPEDTKEFVRALIDSYFMLPQRLAFHDVGVFDENFDEECGSMQYIDDVPVYSLPRCIYTAPIYVMEQFL